jgi:hypothetical protein
MTVVTLTSSNSLVFSDDNHGITFIKMGWYFQVRGSWDARIHSTGKVKLRAVTGTKETAYPFLIVNLWLYSRPKFG